MAAMSKIMKEISVISKDGINNGNNQYQIMASKKYQEYQIEMAGKKYQNVSNI
jgi:hypothetical protein